MVNFNFAKFQKNYMKILNLFFITTLSLLLFINCVEIQKMENVQNKIDEIKSKFAPDKRTAIFDISYTLSDDNVILVGESDQTEAVEKLMTYLKDSGIKFINKIKILPDLNLGEDKFGIINISVANLRTKPAHPAEMATQSLLGTCVNVLQKDNGWYQVQTPDKYISWVDDEGIILVDSIKLKKWKNSKKIFFNKQYGHVFSKSNINSSKISDIVFGSLLKYKNKLKDFIEVEFPDGRIGFVKVSECIDFNEWLDGINANPESIINTAKEFMGIPYLWGGTSSKSFDCSGFSKTVYYANGIILPRDASQQVFSGDLVDTENDFENLQKGDLLFFGFNADGTKKERITHVAIYMGNKNFIHASGKVKINSLDKNSEIFDEFRLKTFIRAKRILGSFDNGENLIKNNPFYF